MNSVNVWAGMALAVAMMTGCAATADTSDEGATSASEGAAKVDCSLVRCALPMCSEGQHLSYQGNSCCPTCVGPSTKCATVLCAAVVCADGEQLVTSHGDCCGHCVAKPAAAECTTDMDCPVFQCIACPCPVSKCVGRTCRTSTPDASTCGEPLPL